MDSTNDDPSKKGEKKGEKKKGSPKNKAPRTPSKGNPHDTLPEHRTVEQWLSMSLEDLQDACRATGLVHDRAHESLANNIYDYYQDVFDEQAFTAVSSANDHRDR